MTKRTVFSVVLVLLLVCSTCQNPMTSEYDPKDPIKKQEAATIIVNSSKGTYLIGESESFTATLKNADGSIVPITDGTWRSELPDVATVDSAGLVTAVSEGYIYIASDHQGMTGQKAILVRGDYRGSWTGTYSIDKCTCSGDFSAAKFCDAQGGSGYPVEFHLEMAGDWLQGTIRLGGLSTTLDDRPELDMAPILEGKVNSAPYTITIYIVPEWTNSGPRFQSMLLEYTANSMKGSARVSCTFSNLTKTGD